MYPSDYGYAAGEDCLSTALYSYSSSCRKTDYLYSGKLEILQAPNASSSTGVAYLDSNGYVSNIGAYGISDDVRTVLYLNTSVQITGGIGSRSNPFKLK